jgi:hypothetical protein
MKAILLAFRLISFVLLAPIWKEFPLWLYHSVRSTPRIDRIAIVRVLGLGGLGSGVGFAMTTPPKRSALLGEKAARFGVRAPTAAPEELRDRP